jgi:hypothetical protein
LVLAKSLSRGYDGIAAAIIYSSRCFAPFSFSVFLFSFLLLSTFSKDLPWHADGTCTPRDNNRYKAEGLIRFRLININASRQRVYDVDQEHEEEHQGEDGSSFTTIGSYP